MAINRLSLLLALFACGCTSWHTQHQPLHLLLQTRPATVRLNVEGQGKVVLRHPALSGDSVVGIEPGLTEQPATEKRRAIGLGEIQSVQTRGLSGGRTILLTLVLATFAYEVAARPGHD